MTNRSSSYRNDDLFKEGTIGYEKGLLLFKAAPTSVLGTSLGIVYMVVVLWDVTPRSSLFAWACSIAAVTVLRGAHAWYFQRHHDRVNMRRWIRQFALGAISSAALFGSTAIFLFPVGHPIEQLEQSLILGLACAVGVTNVSTFRYIIFSFVLLVMPPITFRFFLATDEGTELMWILTSISALLFLLGGNRVNRITHENIEHRLAAVKSETAARRSQQRLENHLQHTPLGVIEWDQDYRVTQWNDAAAAIFGFSHEEALNEDIFSLIFSDPQQDVLASSKQEKINDYAVIECLTKHGDIVLCEWFTTRLVDGHGRAIGMASLVHDITERVRAEQLKDEFLSTVNHELRTPLTSLCGSLNLVLGDATGQLPDKARSLLKMADTNARRLHHLIKDILDIQYLKNDQVDLSLEPMVLSKVVQQSIDENASYAHMHNIKLSVKVTADGVASIDCKRIQQVLDNLISNAVKFSPEGSLVDLILDRHADSIRVSVVDQGKGVPEHFVPKLFDKFTQVDSSNTRHVDGTGLGLSIAKAIVRLHGGQIGFYPLDDGSCFYFELPLDSGL